MIIPILPPSESEDNNDDDNMNAESSSTHPPEWAMIELNGELHLPTDLSSCLQAQVRTTANPTKTINTSVGTMIDPLKDSSDSGVDPKKQSKTKLKQSLTVELGSIQYSKEVCIK